jgi:hypothetical protein
MKRRNVSIELAGMVSFMTILACVIPGQAAQPPLANDPNALSTYIAGTAQVLAEQTAQAASPTLPVPTATEVPPTATAIPTPNLSAQNTLLAFQADGSAIFSDYKAGVEIRLAPIWMPMRINEPEFYTAWETDFVSKNNDVIEKMNSYQTEDVSIFRLVGFDVRPGYIFNGLYTHVSVVYQASNSQTLDERLKYESENLVYLDEKVIASRHFQNINTLDMVELEKSLTGREGGSIYYKTVFFDLPEGMYFVDLYCDLANKDMVIADFNVIINSIKLIPQ